MARRILIVDGHSMIFAWPELRELHARRMSLAREALIRQLTEYQDSTSVHVAVVFDGQGAKSAETSEVGGIQVFYSGGSNTADDVVERLVAKYASDNDITVATSDLLEQQTVTAFGAQAISADSLAELLEDARRAFARESLRYRRKDR